jgi:hypothetical protein
MMSGKAASATILVFMLILLSLSLEGKGIWGISKNRVRKRGKRGRQNNANMHHNLCGNAPTIGSVPKEALALILIRDSGGCMQYVFAAMLQIGALMAGHEFHNA